MNLHSVVMGDGPPVVLIHGISQDSGTWEDLGAHLGEVARVIAIDLPGHGDSENPAGDHSLGAYASMVRDLLLVLGHPSVTLVGHSLGGGIALQFAYQFPEMIDRLVLVDAGGLGEEVSPALRAATLPFAGFVITGLSKVAATDVVATTVGWLDRIGLWANTDVHSVQRGLAGLTTPEARTAFVQTARAVMSPAGQRVSATDKLYLAAHVPTMLVWGEHDRVIPSDHGRAAQAHIPGSRLEIIPRAGHFPHLDDPEAVADLIASFLATTAPSEMAREEWGALLRND